MRLTRHLILLFVFAAALSAADVQTAVLRHSVNTSVTNKDILILAKSGYDEDFLIRVITGGRCNCDTTAEALADLAAQGISQRIIEVMLDSSYRANVPVAAPVAATTAGAPVSGLAVPASVPVRPVEAAGPGHGAPLPGRDGRSVASLLPAKTSAPGTAVSSRVPMFKGMSTLWGVWRKKASLARAPDLGVVPQGLVVNGQWQYGWSAGAAYLPTVVSPGAGRIWHTLPYAAPVVWAPVFVPPVFTPWMVGR